MTALSLYARYALRSFMRGKSRSLFGVFCVAIGVASVIALGLTAANFRASVTGDARRLNRGDVSVSPAGMGFTPTQYRVFARLEARGVITGYTRRLQDDAALLGRGTSTVGSVIGVDPRVFPYHDTIRADAPAGIPLRDMLTTPGSAVVSHDTLASLRLKVGDRVRVNSRHGFIRSYVITGVVPDSAADPFFGAGFWNDFAIVDNRSVAPFFGKINIGATTVYATTATPSDAAAAKATLRRALGPLATIKTVADVAADQENQAAGFDKFFHIMGLVAMIIGGIGIINTMLVATRRRTREVAVLKALGMKGRQVVLAYVLEALVLAVIGTAAGALAGIAVSLGVNGVTENLAGNAVPWSIQPQPLLAGAVVGIAATVLFAYLPIVQASRSRPVATLRETERTVSRHVRRTVLHRVRHPQATACSIPGGIVHLPARQGVRTFLTVLFVAGAIGWIAVSYAGLASGAGAALLGIVAGVGTLVAAALVTQLFVGMVWLVSKLPSMGRLSARMAFRSMATQRRRLASTMLALCIGMLAVGSVAILAQNLREDAGNAIGQQLGFNAVVQVPQNSKAYAAANHEVSTIPGIKRHYLGAVTNSARLVSIDGRDANTVLQRAVAAHRISADEESNIVYDMSGIEARDTRAGGAALKMDAGRYLNATDAGTNHMVMMSTVKALGVHVGSRVTFADGHVRASFSVIGLANSSSVSLMAPNYVDLRTLRSAGMTTPSAAHLGLIYLTIENGKVSGALSALRAGMPNALVLDLSNFTTMIDKSIDKLALFPEIIAALALFAGVIIIANTVALAMLERRREIGVLKAIGARRATVHRFLAIENGIVGFLGAAAGVGLAMVATALVDTQFLKISASFDWRVVGALIALGTLLAVGAGAVTSVPASNEKPLTVLRYE
jgi:predicted lysophospholipase L1 biosynthesis ABC-type transport system permease subunit